MAMKSSNSSMQGMGMNPTNMGLLGGAGGMRMMGTGSMMGAGQNTMIGHSMQMPMMGTQPRGGTNFSPLGMGLGTANQNQFSSLGTVNAQNGLSSNSIGNELDDLFGWNPIQLIEESYGIDGNNLYILCAIIVCLITFL